MQLNYISTRLGVDQDIQEKLDSARMAASKSSPTMECVNFVLQYVDTEVLTQMVPRLVDIIKSNPSIVTRAGAAHVVTTLTHQCPLDLQQFTGKLLSAFLSGLSDRNPAVRINYAGCIGHLMRTAKDSSREKLFNKLKSWYMEKDDEASRAAVAFTFQAVSRHNPDVMKSFASFVMPIAFLAMHEQKTETNEEVLDVWEEVWQEGTPGSEGGIRLFLKEIMELLPVALSSSQWAVKAQTARAIGTVVKKLGDTIQSDTQLQLLELLVTGLEGRTWTGKESLVKSVADIATSAPELLRSNLGDNTDKLINALLRECRKEKIEYKIIALESTGSVLNELKVDKFAEIYTIVGDYLPKPEVGENTENGSNKENEDDDDEETSGKKIELQLAALNCIGLSWPSNQETTKIFLGQIMAQLELVAKNTTRKNQLALVKCLGNIVKNWPIAADLVSCDDQKNLCQEFFQKLATIISILLQIPKYAQLRTETLQIMSQSIKLLDQLKISELGNLFHDETVKSLDAVIKDLGSDPITKTTARDIKTALMNVASD